MNEKEALTNRFDEKIEDVDAFERGGRGRRWIIS
jgi:hypothetical protein